MSVSAAHFKEVTNGYEKRSDGLWVHKGKADIGSARITGYQPPPTGTGMELVYVPGQHTGYMTVYNRDTAVYGDLVLTGKNVNLSPQGGGVVQMPNGSITGAMIADGTVGTADLAPGAAQALIGSYYSTPSFTTTTVSTWVATPVTTGSIACSGAMVRIECSTGIYHSLLNAIMFTGLMYDGVAQNIMSLSYSPGANLAVSVGWTFYMTPPAGNHTFAMGVQTPAAGTLGLSPSMQSALYVTEQRR